MFLENAAALERRRPGRHRQRYRDPHTLAGCARFHRRVGTRGSGCLRSAIGPPTGRNAFAVKEWLAADGDAWLPNDKALGEGFRRDPSGCIGGSSPEGKLVSQVITPDAFEEGLQARGGCGHAQGAAGRTQGALVVDRKVRAAMAIALRWNGERFELQAGRPPGLERPWARGPVVPDETAVAELGEARDATP